MSIIGRLSGALLAETQGEFFLVGDLKEPCDFEREGFEAPTALPTAEQPFVRLQARAGARVSPPLLRLDVEGEALPRLLSERLVITRNASVSERLWRLVTRFEKVPDTDARWLGQMPSEVWNVVRDSVLKCS
jgi:hypothetical protein